MNLDIEDPQLGHKQTILDALLAVMDPELGINIVDLGLVYDIQINQLNHSIQIDMTLSTPSCPMGGLISAHVALAINEVMPDYSTRVVFVWEPRWTAERVTERSRRLLGWE